MYASTYNSTDTNGGVYRHTKGCKERELVN